MKYNKKNRKGFTIQNSNNKERLNKKYKLKELQEEERRAIKLLQEGQFTKAESIYKKMIDQKHINYIILNNFAAILGMKGKEEEMILYLKKSIQIHPRNPEAYNNLGTIYENQGDIELAIDSYKQALSFKNNDPELYYNLGNALKKNSRNIDAIESYKLAIELKPNYVEALNNLGNLLSEEKKYNLAIKYLKKAISLNNGDPEFHYNLGNILNRLGDTDNATKYYRNAIKLNPSYPEANNNLGIIIQQEGKIQEANILFNQALSSNPEYSSAYNNLGNNLEEQGEIDLAKDSYLTAINKKRDFAEAHWNLALLSLLSGDYKEGWSKYEWRFKKEESTKLHANPKSLRWDTSEINNESNILLISEQGLGDTIQFMRYLKVLEERVNKVSFCAQKKLHSLIISSNIHPRPITPAEANLIKDEKWIPLLSLPKYLKVTAKNPIISEAYIKSNTQFAHKWHKLLAEENKPIIGINWQGSPYPEKKTLNNRSFPLDTFCQLSEQIDCSFISLQKGFGSEQLNSCTFKDKFVSSQNIINEIWDFDETAAIIENCDLIITSDTAVAHLAGGLGKPTWLLLKYIPEWRWGLTGETTFWYPSMRLFRKEKGEAWKDIMTKVCKKIKTDGYF